MAVVSDPYGELPMRNDKYAALCTELHLGYKKITQLSGFHAFVNLSTLWLNNNRLTVLEGLDSNIRLRNLHVHCNRIRKLGGSSLVEMKFLNQLTLNDNSLESIDDVVEELKNLRHLTSLDLFGNPISQEDNYRLLIIMNLPWLKCLDRTPITPNEIKEARKLRVKLKKASQLKLSIPTETSLPGQDRPPVSARTESLRYTLPRLRDAFRAKRVFLERTFLESDPRKIGAIPEADFIKALKLYGIFNVITEEELSYVISKYTHSVDVPAISATHTWHRHLVDYRKFCDDVLPSELRVYNEAFQKATPYHVEPVPDISIAAQDLHRYVMKNKTLAQETLEKTKREALLGGNSLSEMGSFSFWTSRTSPGNDMDRQGDLNAWESFQLRKLIIESVLSKKYPGGVPAGVKSPSLASLVTEGITLDESAVRHIFHAMQDMGKVPTMSLEECMMILFGNDGMETCVLVGDLRDVLGCGEIRRVSTAPISGITTGGGGGGGGKGLSKKGGDRRIQWRNLYPHEVEGREEVVFHGATELLDSLLRGANAGGPDAATRQEKLRSMTMQSSITGTRLTASKPVRRTVPVDISPASIIGRAPNRSDVVVIPSLNSSTQRKEQDMQLRKTHDFDTQLSKLGLTGDALDIALARKKRSMTSSGTIIVNAKAAGSIDYNPKPSDRPKKGWATSTGTIVLR